METPSQGKNMLVCINVLQVPGQDTRTRECDAGLTSWAGVAPLLLVVGDAG